MILAGGSWGTAVLAGVLFGAPLFLFISPFVLFEWDEWRKERRQR